MKRFFYFLILLPFLSLPAHAADFNFDIEITSITGDGEGINLGFFSTASVGDVGTGTAKINDDFPGDYGLTKDFSLFQAKFLGIASAGSQSGNPVVHDPLAGTVTVSGGLGGVTGPYPDTPLFAGQFEFVYSGVAGGPEISSNTGLNDFMAGAQMAGYFEGIFFLDEDDVFSDEPGFVQRIDFKATPSEVPLPAGVVLLLSALGMGALVRRRG